MADEDLPEPDAIQFHGFVSQGFLKSSANNYLAASERGSFEYFEAGLAAGKQLTERLRFGTQLFGYRLGNTGDYKVHVDWAYLDYRLRNWLGVRAGRIKVPFGLYNDTADIDAAHATALLPQSVYPQSNRNFLLAQTGVELYGYRVLDDLGALDYRLYAGTIYLDVPDQPPGSSFELSRLEIPYVAGGRVMWEPPVSGLLRLGASLQYLRLDTVLADLRVPGMPMSLGANIHARLWVASAEYIVDDVQLAAEYARWKTSIEDSDDPMLVPEVTQYATRAYGLAAYRVKPWLQTALTYSVFYPGTGQTMGPSAKQHDAGATLRFDLNSHWILKLEGHAMRGTAALTTALNPEVTTLDQLRNRWWLFVAKTTVYF